MPLNTYPLVLKFGGSSVGSPARFKTIVDLVSAYRREEKPLVVVVSALGGVTDLLVDALKSPLQHADMQALSSCMFARHRLHAASVLSLRSQRIYDVHLREHLAELDARLRSAIASAFDFPRCKRRSP